MQLLNPLPATNWPEQWLSEGREEQEPEHTEQTGTHTPQLSGTEPSWHCQQGVSGDYSWQHLATPFTALFLATTFY